MSMIGIQYPQSRPVIWWPSVPTCQRTPYKANCTWFSRRFTKLSWNEVTVRSISCWNLPSDHWVGLEVERPKGENVVSWRGGENKNESALSWREGGENENASAFSWRGGENEENGEDYDDCYCEECVVRQIAWICFTMPLFLWSIILNIFQEMKIPYLSLLYHVVPGWQN